MHPNWKGRRNTLSIRRDRHDDVILCTENPKGPTKKWSELIQKFIKVLGYKINILKVSCIYIHVINNPKIKLRKIITFIIASERINYLGIKCRPYTPKIKKHC